MAASAVNRFVSSEEKTEMDREVKKLLGVEENLE
jgi:hypothetical protein